MCRCKLGYKINEDGTIPLRCHVDWDDGFYPALCKECPFYISEYELDYHKNNGYKSDM